MPDIPFPLRPFWITPATSQFPDFTSNMKVIPVVCVSASKQIYDGLERRSNGYAYVQGSGDDHELWAMVSLGRTV
jgi:tRNA A64-2'-O-ribosylphosphate transferase